MGKSKKPIHIYVPVAQYELKYVEDGIAVLGAFKHIETAIEAVRSSVEGSVSFPKEWTDIVWADFIFGQVLYKGNYVRYLTIQTVILDAMPRDREEGDG
jgi:hypothetical protein